MLILCFPFSFLFFFFTDTSTTDIYTLSLHDALPIWNMSMMLLKLQMKPIHVLIVCGENKKYMLINLFVKLLSLLLLLFLLYRSEEHTSELQSLRHLVCRLLLEKKKRTNTNLSPYEII